MLHLSNSESRIFGYWFYDINEIPILKKEIDKAIEILEQFGENEIDESEQEAPIDIFGLIKKKEENILEKTEMKEILLDLINDDNFLQFMYQSYLQKKNQIN